jgi:hypothetical protein
MLLLPMSYELVLDARVHVLDPSGAGDGGG